MSLQHLNDPTITEQWVYMVYTHWNMDHVDGTETWQFRQMVAVQHLWFGDLVIFNDLSLDTLPYFSL